MAAYRRLLEVLLLYSLAFAVSCSSSTPATPSISGQAIAPTTVPTAAPTVAVATEAPKATTAPTQGAVSTPAPTQATVPTTTPTAAPTATQAKATTAPAATTGASKPGTFGKAELDKIFPPGKGQDLVFQACVNCHNWVPLVMADLDKAAWEQNKLNHRERVTSLSDQDFSFLYNYLVETFPQGHPVADNIPEDLLSQWTSY